MSTRNRHPRRGIGHETAGSIDYPWDHDPQADEVFRNDVTCAIPWRADGYEAVEVFLDPALRERADEICATVRGIAGAHDDLDTLADAILEYGEQSELSPSIHESPRDAPSKGVVAVSITLG